MGYSYAHGYTLMTVRNYPIEFLTASFTVYDFLSAEIMNRIITNCKQLVLPFQLLDFTCTDFLHCILPHNFEFAPLEGTYWNYRNPYFHRILFDPFE